MIGSSLVLRHSLLELCIPLLHLIGSDWTGSPPLNKKNDNDNKC